MNGWAKVRDAAKHAGVSERTFRNWLKTGLRYSRLKSGTILIKFEWLDSYLEGFESTENKVDKVVEETLMDFGIKAQ